ncbi:hypothetical protein [Metallibacterium scheffleri]
MVRLLLIATRDLSRCSVANEENREKVKRRREQARDAGKISGSDARYGQHARGSDWSAADVGGGGGAREHDSKVKRWMRACQHFFLQGNNMAVCTANAGAPGRHCVRAMHRDHARGRCAATQQRREYPRRGLYRNAHLPLLSIFSSFNSNTTAMLGPTRGG